MPELPAPVSIPVESHLSRPTGAAAPAAGSTEILVERPDGRHHVSNLALIGIALFAVGLVAVAVILVLFATGWTDLPLWLNLAAMLAPVGFGLGLVGVFVEARTSTRPAEARGAGPAVSRTSEDSDEPQS